MALNVKDLKGNEIADDYVRCAPEAQGKWSETWAVFKGSFGKVVLINLLMLIFCAPAVTLLVTRTLYVGIWAFELPLNSNTGVGYPFYSDPRGLVENLYLQVDLIFYAVLIGADLIASVGISGGAYSLKKLLNTQGKFTFKGFFHGVKIGYFKTLLPVTVFLLFYYATVLVGDWKDLVIARGGSAAGPITAYVFIIMATIIVGFISAMLLAVGVSYRVKLSVIIKTSLKFVIAAPIQTILIAGIALIPVWLYLLGTAVTFISYIAYAVFVFFGLSLIVLVWMSYTQWLFDAVIPPDLKSAEESKKKAQNTAKTVEERDEKDIARELLAAGRSELICKPILPISDKVAVSRLGATYCRNDLARIADERQKLGKEISDYEQKHSNDSVYAEYNKLFSEREKPLQDNGKKGKKNKVSAKNLLNSGN